MSKEPRKGPWLRDSGSARWRSPEPITGAIMTPIFQTATYVQNAVGEPNKGNFDYGELPIQHEKH
ncbi:MAG: hypothetical protein CM1200mP14_15290 [Gammaproteobacteria bacterium]|nr:MAG: hypothetical protein CM1200mP14_15290 [Gammaproteobacteria bacterium]